MVGGASEPAAASADEAAKSLRSTVAGLPALEPTGEADLWTQKRNEVRRLILQEDVRAFQSWPPLIQTMVVGNPRYVLPELRRLKAEPQWADRWRPALREDETGHPPPYPLQPGSSGNAIHMAHHVLMWEQHGGAPLGTFDVVAEFGGGYGAFARTVRRLGFTGTHHIHDLPEFGALQRYFLTCTLGRDLVGTGVTLSDDHAAFPDPGPGQRALFVAMWSLSETPLALRDAWLPILQRFDHLLIGYQDVFEGIDNVAWFAGLEQARPDLTWTTVAVPTFAGNSYLIARPRR